MMQVVIMAAEASLEVTNVAVRTKFWLTYASKQSVGWPRLLFVYWVCMSPLVLQSTTGVFEAKYTPRTRIDLA